METEKRTKGSNNHRGGFLSIGERFLHITPPKTSEELANVVKQEKDKPWYRRLKREGVRMVPLPHPNGLRIIVGAPTLIGLGFLGYLTYKHILEQNKQKKQ